MTTEEFARAVLKALRDRKAGHLEAGMRASNWEEHRIILGRVREIGDIADLVREMAERHMSEDWESEE